MDQWILAFCQSLTKFVQEEMKAYRLYTVIPRLVQFVDQLTNWYVRFNRKRLKGDNGNNDRDVSLNVLFEVLFTMAKAMAPFTPFFTEYLYQGLRPIIPNSEDSVHYLSFPTPKDEFRNEKIENAVARLQAVVVLGRTLRDQKKLPVKLPLRELVVIHKNKEYLADLELLKTYLLEELNVRTLSLTSDVTQVQTSLEGKEKNLGPKLKKDLKKVSTALKAFTMEQIKELKVKKEVNVEGHTVTWDDVQVVQEFAGDPSRYVTLSDYDVIVLLDVSEDTSLQNEGNARELVNRIQKLRKKVGLQVTDDVEAFYHMNDSSLMATLLSLEKYIESATKISVVPLSHKARFVSTTGFEEVEFGGSKGTIFLVPHAFSFFEKSLRAKCPNDAVMHAVEEYVNTRNFGLLKAEFQAKGKLPFTVDGHTVELVLGEDVFLSAREFYNKEPKLGS